jgi:ribonuclease HI
MAKKYYAVKVGLTPGVYETWDECESNVKGYSGAKFKSFSTKAEAEAFVNGGEPVVTQQPLVSHTTVVSTDGPIAYVDGSFDASTNTYSYGIVVIDNGVEVQLNGKESNEENASLRNVAGEILASQTAISYALSKGYNRITIYHDYQGLSSWANGDWKAKTDLTKAYKAFCEDARNQGLTIFFEKVKGHSGDYYNDLVDALAKDALGIPLEKKSFAELLHPNEVEWDMDER